MTAIDHPDGPSPTHRGRAAASAIRALRRRYPDATLIYLVEETAAPIVLPIPT